MAPDARPVTRRSSCGTRCAISVFRQVQNSWLLPISTIGDSMRLPEIAFERLIYRAPLELPVVVSSLLN